MNRIFVVIWWWWWLSVISGGGGGSSYCDDYGEGDGGDCDSSDSSTGGSDGGEVRTVLSCFVEVHCKYSVTFTNLGNIHSKGSTVTTNSDCKELIPNRVTITNSITYEHMHYL
jgi:hypothetical protein